jgi:hypothetical protein
MTAVPGLDATALAIVPAFDRERDITLRLTGLNEHAYAMLRRSPRLRTLRGAGHDEADARAARVE